MPWFITRLLWDSYVRTVWGSECVCLHACRFMCGGQRTTLESVLDVGLWWQVPSPSEPSWQFHIQAKKNIVWLGSSVARSYGLATWQEDCCRFKVNLAIHWGPGQLELYSKSLSQAASLPSLSCFETVCHCSPGWPQCQCMTPTSASCMLE